MGNCDSINSVIVGFFTLLGSLIANYYVLRRNNLERSFELYKEIRERLYKPLIKIYYSGFPDPYSLERGKKGELREILIEAEDLIYLCPSPLKRKLYKLRKNLNQLEDKEIYISLNKICRRIEKIDVNLVFKG